MSKDKSIKYLKYKTNLYINILVLQLLMNKYLLANICPKAYFYRLVIFFLIICVVCLDAKTQNVYTRQNADSIIYQIADLQGEKRLELYGNLCESLYDQNNFNTHLQCIDAYVEESDKYGNVNAGGSARMCRIRLFANYNKIDSLFLSLPQYLEFWSKNRQWKLYFSARHTEVEKLLCKQDYVRSLQEATDMYRYATRLKDQYGIGAALAAMGRVYLAINKIDEAEALFKESITLTEDEKSNGLLSQSYDRLCFILTEKGEYEELLSVLEQWEKSLQEEEPNLDPQSGGIYVNMSTAWFDLFLKKAYAYSKLGDLKKADVYIQKARLLEISKTDINANMMRMIEAIYYEILGDYDKALSKIDSVYTHHLELQDRINIIFILECKARIALKAKRSDAAIDAYKQLMEVRNTIDKSNLMARIEGIKANYEIEKIDKARIENRNYMFTALVLSILCLILLSGWIFYSRKLKMRNMGLLRQMNEYDKLSNELDRNEEELKRLHHLSGDVHISEDNDELYSRLKDLMKNPDVYTNSSLSRKSLAEMLGTNEKYLYETIKKHFGMTFSEYLTNLRLNYAREMLSDLVKRHTIEDIALGSGFGSRNTFHRLFRERYGLTPDEFRRMAVGS